jgi:hypothetical protein
MSGHQKAADKAQLILRMVIERALSEPVAEVRDGTEFGLLMISLLEQGYLPPEMGFVVAKMDAFLTAQLPSSLARSDFDQFTGYLAIGRYFLRRGPFVVAARAGLALVIDNLLATAQVTKDGYCWRSQFRGRSAVDFSWSHGMAGLLLFLAEYVSAEVDYRLEEVRRALRAGACFMAHHKLQHSPNLYPSILGEPPASAPLNLCYGDLGVAYALWKAANVLAEPAAQDQALEQLFQLAGRRQPAAYQVYDASVIYGTSGLTLLFQRLFAQTQQPAFEQAADYWYAQGLKLNRHQGYVVGYRNYYNRTVKCAYSSFFEGLAGYGLTLLQHQTEEFGLLELIGY